MSVDNPLKWLLHELPGYIEPEALAVLMQRYEANKKAYERQVTRRALERKIKNAQHWPPSSEKEIRLARWQAKLAKLKEEAL